MTYFEIIAEARRLAAEGYGWQDIVARSGGNNSEHTAKQIEREVERGRKQ